MRDYGYYDDPEKLRAGAIAGLCFIAAVIVVILAIIFN